MDGKRTQISIKKILISVALLHICFTRPVIAGVINFYTDYAASKADATAASLTITTENFTTEPLLYPGFSVGGIDFLVDNDSSFDANNERIGFTSGGGCTLKLDYTGGSNALFLFGFNKGPTVGEVQITDFHGADGTFDTTRDVIGVLATAETDPVNPFPTNISLSGNPKYGCPYQ